MDHFISLAEAEEMTAVYRSQREAILAEEFQNQNILPICETYDKEAFAVLLAKPECAQIRIYYGMDEKLKIHAIIVAADANGKDILPRSVSESGVVDDIIDRGLRCPELCPDPSPLNS
jgi:hypothetical protein